MFDQLVRLGGGFQWEHAVDRDLQAAGPSRFERALHVGLAVGGPKRRITTARMLEGSSA